MKVFNIFAFNLIFQISICYSQTPVGSVIAYSGDYDSLNADVFGWLPADGRSLQINRYPTLFKTFGWKYGFGSDTIYNSTFQLPDYRGLFLRGLAENSEQDPDNRNRLDPVSRKTVLGNEVGSFQKYATANPVENKFTAEASGSHHHRVLAEDNASRNPETDGKKCCYETMTRHFSNGTVQTEDAGTHGHKIIGGDAETRPSNMAVIWLIKAY